MSVNRFRAFYGITALVRKNTGILLNRLVLPIGRVALEGSARSTQNRLVLLALFPASLGINLQSNNFGLLFVCLVGQLLF